MAKDPLEMLRQQAQEAIARGQYQEARQIFQQALGYRTDSPEIHYGLATACFLLADLHSAVHHFKEVIRLDPMRAGAYINLGAVYNRLGQFEDSLATLRRGIQLNANRAEGYYNLGLVYRQLGQLEMAVNAYREAVRLSPHMYDAHYNLGNIFFEKGQFALAVAHYKSALEIRPSWEKGRIALEAAQREQTGVGAPAEKPAEEPSVPATPGSTLDPNRLIDPTIHATLLRALHELVVDTDGKSHAMLEFLQKEVDSAIRELSICILTPKDPRHNLDDQIRRFDEVVSRLQQLQDSLQKRIVRVKTISEQIIKV